MDAGDQIAQLEAQLAAKDVAFEAQLAAKDAVIEAQRLQIQKLEETVARLIRQVSVLMAAAGQNSSNSHLPPSSDGPGGRPSGGSRGGKSNKSGRKRGGQPGHGGKKRDLLPPEQVQEVIDLYPKYCGNCQAPLPQIPDAKAVRRQVTDIPPIRPYTKEFRGHAVGCACGHVTRADMAGVPKSPFGARLMAIIGNRSPPSEKLRQLSKKKIDAGFAL